MDEKKPSSVGEYKKWLAQGHGCEMRRAGSYYQSVTSKAKSDVEKSDFWSGLRGEVQEFNDQYQGLTGFPLLMSGQSLEIYVKPFESFVLKTFRKNVVDNKNWPEEPPGGWFIPDRCFVRVSGMLRTLMVVKYMDGVRLLERSLKTFCKERNVGYRTSFEARDDGYYAAHTYMKQMVEIPKMTWDTEILEVSVEVQITTQLQETIRKLLHKYYEKKRERAGTEHWQWDYKSDEFAANYLGHMLHYIEGMIVEIREKQSRGLR
jgi:hypothetical protein